MSGGINRYKCAIRFEYFEYLIKICDEDGKRKMPLKENKLEKWENSNIFLNLQRSMHRIIPPVIRISCAYKN